MFRASGLNPLPSESTSAETNPVNPPPDPEPFKSTFHQRATRILVWFSFTFMAARILSYLIVSNRIPDIYLQLGGTHIHHLNYGIFLLSGVGAYLLLGRPSGKGLRWALALYGIGLALTFDEFGMWVHLEGTYWQRASFDAVVVIATFFALIALSPHLSRFRPRHWFTTGVLLLALILFGVMLVDSFNYAHRILYRIQILEEGQSPASESRVPR